MANKRSGGNERGKWPVRDNRYDDNGVFHPYIRHQGNIYEATPSTSGAPPIAHMPRYQNWNTMPNSVPPRAHSTTSAQFSMPSPQEPMISSQGSFYSSSSVSPHRVQIPVRAPPPARLAAASAHRMASRQSPIPSGYGTSASSTRDEDSPRIITVGDVHALISLFNQQYPKPGGRGDDSGEDPIADSDANSLIQLFNQLKQKKKRGNLTSTVTSADFESYDHADAAELSDVQYGGPSSFPTQSSTSPYITEMAYEPQYVYNDEPSTSYQPSTSNALMTMEPEYDYDDDSSVDDEHSTVQARHKDDAPTQQTADKFGDYLASCLKDMKGKARVNAENAIFNCLNKLRNRHIKDEVIDIVTPPASPNVNVLPIEESPSALSLIVSEEPEADFRRSPSPMPYLPRPAQQPWPSQQQWSPRQLMHQWQQQQNYGNMGQNPVTTIYSQVHPSHVESILWTSPQRRLPQPGAHNMYFPMQHMFQPPQLMQRPPFALPPDYFNPAYDMFFNDWDQRF